MLIMCGKLTKGGVEATNNGVKIMPPMVVSNIRYTIHIVHYFDT